MHSMRPSGGKEELRATILRPYLIRMREERGEQALIDLLTKAGAKGQRIEHDGTWLSASLAVRILQALRDELGRECLLQRGAHTVHPQNLATYLQLLRRANSPVKGYRYLAEHATESTRIGEWSLEKNLAAAVKTSKSEATSDVAPVAPRAPAEPQEKQKGGESSTEATEPTEIRLVYRPRVDVDELPDLTANDEKILCRCRHGELISLPRLYGYGDAHVEHTTCLARKDACCTYIVHLHAEKALPVPIGLLTGLVSVAVLSLVWLTGTLLSAIFAASTIGAMTFFVLRQRETNHREERERTYERHRALALEHGIDQKQESRELGGDLIGAVLGGKYRVSRRIGAGGIGSVYAAEHVTLGHEVAVKVLRGAAAKDAGEVARLRREAQIQTHIEHANIARVFDLDHMPDGSIYVVMERLIGRSLADRLQREGALAPGFLIPVFIQVCQGLAAAHEQGVVHRDLKPGNVFVCEDGTPKLLDFGMSKLTTAEALTQQGYTLGTPEYMAPEQCIGAAVEPRTDLYAFGVLMYEMLTGVLPIRTPNRRELLDLHQREVPKSMRSIRPDLPIPHDLDDAVLMCLQKRIADRPKSARFLGEMLARIPLDDLATLYAKDVGRRTPEQVAALLAGEGSEGQAETQARIPSE
jgi:eukaryotic-like serine/threonine-protein kinase